MIAGARCLRENSRRTRRFSGPGAVARSCLLSSGAVIRSCLLRAPHAGHSRRSRKSPPDKKTYLGAQYSLALDAPVAKPIRRTREIILTRPAPTLRASLRGRLAPTPFD